MGVKYQYVLCKGTFYKDPINVGLKMTSRAWWIASKVQLVIDNYKTYDYLREAPA